MMMNPEFKRNLWQELTRERLIAMPIILIALFWIGYLKYGLTAVPTEALGIIFLLLVVWGSGLAVDAIFSEIRDHTWDGQRMTPLSAWSMTWGKLFGSTIFVWYGTLICLLVILFTNIHFQNLNPETIVYDVLYYLLTGLFVQALAFFIALLFQRISPLRTRSRVVLIQLFVISLGGLFFYFGIHLLPMMLEVYSWYDLKIPNNYFILSSQLVWIGWLIFGIYRLLGFELKIKSYPWGWPLFVIFFIFYLLGFLFMLGDSLPKVSKQVLYLAVAYFSLLHLTFLAAFFAPKNIVTAVRLQLNFQQRQWLRVGSLIPQWTLSGVMGGLLLIPLVYFIFKISPEEMAGIDLRYRLAGYCIGLFCFLLRDLGVLYYLTWDVHAKRAHLATVVYLIVLYALLPVLLNSMGFSSHWLPIIAPWGWFFMDGTVDLTQVLTTNFWVLIQAIIMTLFVWQRWQRHQKTLV